MPATIVPVQTKDVITIDPFVFKKYSAHLYLASRSSNCKDILAFRSSTSYYGIGQFIQKNTEEPWSFKSFINITEAKKYPFPIKVVTSRGLQQQFPNELEQVINLLNQEKKSVAQKSGAEVDKGLLQDYLQPKINNKNVTEENYISNQSISALAQKFDTCAPNNKLLRQTSAPKKCRSWMLTISNPEQQDYDALDEHECRCMIYHTEKNDDDIIQVRCLIYYEYEHIWPQRPFPNAAIEKVKNIKTCLEYFSDATNRISGPIVRGELPIQGKRTDLPDITPDTQVKEKKQEDKEETQPPSIPLESIEEEPKDMPSKSLKEKSYFILHITTDNPVEPDRWIGIFAQRRIALAACQFNKKESGIINVEVIELTSPTGKVEEKDFENSLVVQHDKDYYGPFTTKYDMHHFVVSRGPEFANQTNIISNIYLDRDYKA